MRKTQGKKLVLILGPLALAAFVLIMFPTQSWAAAPAADNDGFPDSDELPPGIILPEGMSLAATEATNLPNCSDSGLPRDQCMDEATPDLFVIMDRAVECPSSIPCGEPCAPLFDNDSSTIPESNIPFPTVYDYGIYFDPLGLVKSGLEIAVHEIFQAPGYTDQGIANHYALRIVENLDPCGVDFGYAPFSTPYQYSTGVVWTERIKNWIEGACSEACFDFDGDGIYGQGECFTPATSGITSFKCKNAISGTEIDMQVAADLSQLDYEFIENIINHEVGHLIYLASGKGTFDHHYDMGEGVVMEQFIEASQTINKQRNKITVTLYISTQFSRASQQNYQLQQY